MDKWQAQQYFWESFGIPAYDDQAAFPYGENPAYPHITYESFGGIMGQAATLSASIWYRDTSMEPIKKKAAEILRYLESHRPTVIEIEGGYLWLKAPTAAPFARPLASGSEDGMIKRIVLTVEAETLAAF